MFAQNTFCSTNTLSHPLSIFQSSMDYMNAYDSQNTGGTSGTISCSISKPVAALVRYSHGSQHGECPRNIEPKCQWPQPTNKLYPFISRIKAQHDRKFLLTGTKLPDDF